MFSKLKNVTLRPRQQQAIDFFMKSKKRFIIMELSVGEGKSVLGMKIAEMLIEQEGKNDKQSSFRVEIL